MTAQDPQEEKTATKVVVEEVPGDAPPEPAASTPASTDSITPDSAGTDTSATTPASALSSTETPPTDPVPTADMDASTETPTTIPTDMSTSMDSPDTSPSDSDGGDKDGKGKPKIGFKEVFFIAFPTAIIVAALTGGILYYNNNKTAEEAPTLAPAATATPTAEPEETASPSAELSRSDLSVQILNGIGEAGVATTAQTLLEDLGYEDISTANAATYDFEETVISIKEDKEDYLDMIIEDLEDSYTIADDTETLDEDSDYDVTITVGSS